MPTQDMKRLMYKQELEDHAQVCSLFLLLLLLFPFYLTLQSGSRVCQPSLAHMMWSTKCLSVNKDCSMHACAALKFLCVNIGVTYEHPFSPPRLQQFNRILRLAWELVEPGCT